MTSAGEIQLTFDWGGVALAGSLLLPHGPAPHPAVVMAQGSGAADRDSDGYFVPIRRALYDHGVATFSFDKPGCGESSGDWRDYGLSGRSEQLVAALDIVRAQSQIDAARVGIWGHSQGGWLVQMLAGRAIDVAFAIASSAPSLGVAKQIAYDCEQSLRGQGYDPPQLQAALSLVNSVLEAARGGSNLDAVSQTLLQPASHEPWYDGFPAPEDDADWHHLQQLVGEPFDPLDAIRRVECPFLAIYGGLDPLLPPWQGAQETGMALAAAPTTDATVVVFPDGDHRLQDPATGTTFVAGYLDLLTSWIRKRAFA